MMRSMGGITQVIPADRLAPQPQGRRRMQESLMMSAAQLGLSAQDVADLVAFLRNNGVISPPAARRSAHSVARRDGGIDSCRAPRRPTIDTR